MDAIVHDVIGELTLNGVLDARARRSPNRTFLTWDMAGGPRIELTWSGMASAVADAVTELARLDVGTGDRFCVHARNRPETVLLLFAAAAAGATAIPTNVRLTPPELAYLLRHSAAKAIFTETEHVTMVGEAIRQAEAAPSLIDLGASPGGASLACTPVAAAVRSSTVRAPAEPGGRRENERDVVVLYTSGTTADPKGVRISQAALLHAGYSIALGTGFGPEDSNFAALPLFHVNSLCYTLMSALMTGGAVVLSDRFSASSYFRQAAETGATFGWMAATPMRMLLAQPPGLHDRAHRLRRVVFGQNLTAPEFAEWERRFAIPLQQIYGMTETVMLPLMSPLHEDVPVDAIGRPAMGTRARVVAESGIDATAGDPGELWLKLEPRRQMMSGYLFDDDATSRSFTGEWFRTGDWVVRDDDGLFRFLDRRRDVLKVSGENVSASEVERVLNEHRAVFDSAVVGRPDALKGQVIKAYVVLEERASAAPEELMAWCRARLASFKVPVEIEVRAEFPRTSAGKVQKGLL